MTTDKRLTVAEAAAALGKHPVTIRRLLAAGMLPTERVGGRVFIPAAAIAGAGRRVCPQCGKDFTPGRYATRGRFCSDACRRAAAYATWKAAHPAPRGPGRPPKVTPERSGEHRAAPGRLAAALEIARPKPTA